MGHCSFDVHHLYLRCFDEVALAEISFFRFLHTFTTVFLQSFQCRLETRLVSQDLPVAWHKSTAATYHQVNCAISIMTSSSLQAQHSVVCPTQEFSSMPSSMFTLFRCFVTDGCVSYDSWLWSNCFDFEHFFCNSNPGELNLNLACQSGCAWAHVQAEQKRF